MNSFRLLSLAAVLLVASPALGQQNTLQFPDMTGTAGDSFLWSVSLSGASVAVGLQFDLKFPTGQLTVNAGVEGPDGLSVLATARELAPGLVRVVLSTTKNKPLPKDVVLEMPVGLQAASPAGGPAYAVEKIILALADGTRVPATTSFGPLTNWRTQFFTAAELLQSSLIADDADPDRDGMPNLLEYAGGGNPRLFLPGDLPTSGFVVLTEAGQDRLFLALNYRRARNAPGVVLQPEVSDDLRLWLAADNVVPTGDGDATSVPMQARVLVGGEPEQYLRLRVSRRGL